MVRPAVSLITPVSGSALIETRVSQCGAGQSENRPDVSAVGVVFYSHRDLHDTCMHTCHDNVTCHVLSTMKLLHTIEIGIARLTDLHRFYLCLVD